MTETKDYVVALRDFIVMCADKDYELVVKKGEMGEAFPQVAVTGAPSLLCVFSNDRHSSCIEGVDVKRISPLEVLALHV